MAQREDFPKQNKEEIHHRKLVFLRDYAQQVELAWTSNDRITAGHGYKNIVVGWSAPPANWIKLNTDGCSKGNPGNAVRRGGLTQGK